MTQFGGTLVGWFAVLIAVSIPLVGHTQEARVKADDAAHSDYRPLPRRDTILTGATILDGAGNRYRGDVLMRDGRIVATGEVKDPGNAFRIDATGRWVTPGIIDVHTHYGVFLLPQGETRTDYSDVTEVSETNAAHTWIEDAVRPSDPAFAYALASGVTTAQILPGSASMIGGRTLVVRPIPAVTVEQMRFPGAQRGLKFACGGNPLNESSFPTSRQGLMAALRRALGEGREYAARPDNGEERGERGRPRLNRAGDPRAASIADAIAGRIPVHLHCYRADDIASWIATFRQYGIERVTVHHATEAYKIAPLLARNNVCVALWADWWGFKREAEDGIPENAAFVEAAGGCVTMHSDIPVLGTLLNIEAAKAAASGRRAGIDIPPEQAIRWLTSNAARVLGLEDRIGTIAPDMIADVVLWSGDPFSISSKPDLVFIDGAIAFDRNDPGRQPRTDATLGQPARKGLE